MTTFDCSLVGHASQSGFDKALNESTLRGDFAERVPPAGGRSAVDGAPCLFINGQRYDSQRDADRLIELFRGRGWIAVNIANLEH